MNVISTEAILAYSHALSNVEDKTSVQATTLLNNRAAAYLALQQWIHGWFLFDFLL